MIRNIESDIETFPNWKKKRNKKNHRKGVSRIKRNPLCIFLNNILHETDHERIPILRLFALLRTPPFVISSSQP